MRTSGDPHPSSPLSEEFGYAAYHAPRYRYVLRLLSGLGLGGRPAVLDIGPSPLTAMIRDHLGVPVDTLGFDPERSTPEGRHYHFDLNLTQDRAAWRHDLPSYDLVVMAEVLEHLHTAPQLVLAFVTSLLGPRGLLVLQTPNAAALSRRVKALIGRNPYEMIRLDPSNPGHFREYTVSELQAIVAGLDLELLTCRRRYYFDARYARHGGGRVAVQPVAGFVKNLVYGHLPPSLRQGITMVCRKRSAGIPRETR